MTPEPVTSVRSRLLAGGGLLVAAAFIGLISNYVFNVLMSWLLPVDDYGVLAEAQILLLIGGTVLSAGFPWTVAQFISSVGEAQRGRSDPGSVRGVIHVGLLGNLALALCLGVGISIWVFSGSSALSEGIKDLFVPITLALGLYAPLYVLRGALQGTFRFAELGLLAPIEALVKLIVATGLVVLGFGVPGAAIGFAVGAVLALAVGSVFLRRSIPWGHAEWPRLSTFSPTAPVFVGFVALAWVMHIDLLGLGLRGVDSQTFGDIGHYHAAALMARAPVYAVAALMAAAFPFLVRSARSKELFVDALSLVGRIVILVMIPVVLVYTMMPGAVLKLFFPESFSAAGPSLAILSVAALGFALSYVLVVGLQAYGRPHVGAWAIVAAVLVQGIALSVLVPRMGPEGAAISTLLGSVSALVLLLIPCVWTMGIVARLQDLALLGASSSIFASVLFILPHDTRVSTVVSVGTASIAYALCLLIIPSSNRYRFFRYVRSLAVTHVPQGKMWNPFATLSTVGGRRRRQRWPRVTGGVEDEPGVVSCSRASLMGAGPGKAPNDEEGFLTLDHSRRLRILVFSWRDIKHPWAGGSEVNHHEQARRWAAVGHKVTVFCAQHPTVPRSPSREVINGVEIVRKGNRFTCYVWAIWYYLRHFRGRYDCVLDIHNGIPFFTPLYCRLPKLLLVHHVHLQQWRREFRLPLRTVGWVLEKWIMPIIYRRQIVVAASPSTKQSLVGLGFDQSRIHVIFNGLDQQSYKVNGRKSESKRIVYVGRLMDYKNLSTLLQVFGQVVEEVPSATLDIVGDGPSRRGLQQLSEQLGLNATARFRGFVSQEEKVQLLQEAALFVTPSLNEGWGLALLEANACGTPCVAFKAPGLVDSIVDGKTGFTVESPEQMRERIIELLSDWDALEKLSSHAVEWARTFSWDRCSAGTLRLLDELVVTCPPKTVPRKMTVLREAKGGLDAKEPLLRGADRRGPERP